MAIGETIADGTVTWAVKRKFTDSSNTISDCNNATSGISLFNATTANTPANVAGTLVTVGSGATLAQIAVTSESQLWYRNYTTAWSAWNRLTVASEIINSMHFSTNSSYVCLGNLFRYIKLQWGLSMFNSSGVATVTLPISFSTGNQVYYPVITAMDNPNNIYFDSRSITNVSFTAHGTANRSFSWFAMGQ